MTAKYSALLRQHYYTSTIGSNRPNPKLWQPNIWSHVIAIRQANEYSGSLPHHTSLGLLGPLAQAHSPSAGPSRPTPKAPPRSRHPAPRLPFRPSPSGGSRSASGACFICGRATDKFPHDVATCTTATAGRTTPYAYRNERRHLLRVSDHTSICILTVLSSVEVLHKLRPELESAQRPLNADGFECVLLELGLMDDYGDLLAGLRNGFDFGIPPLRETRTPPNHLSATENEDVLGRIAASEIEKGRWAGPFTRTEVETVLGPFQSSPMGLIPKSNGDWRLVQDLSYPRDG
ncbi:hypothetical protein CF328_g9541, partial [Tilletia controversa]